MTDTVDAFIEALAGTNLAGHAFNQYQYAKEPVIAQANDVRRQNLRLYFCQMAELKPKILFVGEAAGYRGCRRTGVPFTSEKLLLNGINFLSEQITATTGLFGRHAGYRQPTDSIVALGEATATMVWDELSRQWPPPLLWNAFPFHPHKPENPSSNRAPNENELKIGLPLLLNLAELFGITRYIAVGKSAEKSLESAGIDCYYLRHPSHGGKQGFATGFASLTRPLDDLHYTSAHASNND